MSCPPAITSKDAITNLLKYSDSHQNLLQKYSTVFYIDYFDQSTIQELEETMGARTYTEVEFIKIMVQFVLHPRDETLFLVMSLIEVFGRIADEGRKEREEISVKDFTQHICNIISNQCSELILYTKEMPSETTASGNPQIPRDIDINAAVIHSHSEKQSPKISKSLKKLERRVDNDKPLHTFQVNSKTKEVITLGRMSSQINIFNFQLNRTTTITPHCFQVYNRSAIMSMAFSESQQRIGCIITHTGLAFWDY